MVLWFLVEGLMFFESLHGSCSWGGCFSLVSWGSPFLGDLVLWGFAFPGFFHSPEALFSGVPYF